MGTDLPRPPLITDLERRSEAPECWAARWVSTTRSVRRDALRRRRWDVWWDGQKLGSRARRWSRRGGDGGDGTGHGLARELERTCDTGVFFTVTSLPMIMNVHAEAGNPL